MNVLIGKTDIFYLFIAVFSMYSAYLVLCYVENILVYEDILFDSLSLFLIIYFSIFIISYLLCKIYYDFHIKKMQRIKREVHMKEETTDKGELFKLTCKYCGKDILFTSAICPYCGSDNNE